MNPLISRCKEFLNNIIEIENKEALFQCYKNRIEFGCTYDDHTEEKLDIIHEHCYQGLAPPWWVDLLD